MIDGQAGRTGIEGRDGVGGRVIRNDFRGMATARRYSIYGMGNRIVEIIIAVCAWCCGRCASEGKRIRYGFNIVLLLFFHNIVRRMKYYDHRE